jgi:maleate isomerase
VTGERLTIGVVTPHAAAGPEVELPAMTSDRITTIVCRTGSPQEASQAPRQILPPVHAELRASTELAAIDRAVIAFRGRPIAAVGRVQLVHPPWFDDDDFDELGEAFFHSQGIDAVASKPVGLPGDPARVEPHHVVDWVEHHIDDRAEAVFLAGNGFRAAGAVEELERRTGRLALQANQAMLWGILSATGARWRITGYERLLRASTAATSG